MTLFQNSVFLRELIVSHNKFSGEGGMILGSAIGKILAKNI
jgi:hypothetical protein